MDYRCLNKLLLTLTYLIFCSCTIKPKNVDLVHHNGKLISGRSIANFKPKNISLTYLGKDSLLIPDRVKSIYNDLVRHKGEASFYKVQIKKNGEDVSNLPAELFEVGLKITKAPEFTSDEGKLYFTLDEKARNFLEKIISEKFVVLNIYYSKNVYAAIIDDNGPKIFGDYINLFETEKSILLLTRFADFLSVGHEYEHLVQERRGELTDIATVGFDYINTLNFNDNSFNTKLFKVFKRYVYEVNAYKISYKILNDFKNEEPSTYYSILEGVGFKDSVEKREANSSYFLAKAESIFKKSNRYRDSFYNNVYDYYEMAIIKPGNESCNFIKKLNSFEQKNFTFFEYENNYKELVHGLCNF